MEKTIKEIKALLNNKELMVVAGIAAVVIGGAVYLIKKNEKEEKVDKEKVSERFNKFFKKNKKEVESK